MSAGPQDRFRVFIEILIVAVLTMVNGVLAMSELAVVSSRPARLQAMAAESRGAATALRLAKDSPRQSILVNLSGRGDKDIDFVVDKYGIR